MALGANHTFTLQHYRAIFTDGMKAIRDTLIIAAFAMPLGGLYGVLLGYLVAKRNFIGRRTMELVSMVNYALPGTIVGIAYLIAFNDPPIELTGTALIIVACYVFRYGPTGIRATIALLQQIDKSLEEASQGLGAGTATTFRRITLPLILPCVLRRARRCVHPVDDGHQRDDLSRLDRLDAHYSQDPREHHRAVARSRRRVFRARRRDRVRRGRHHRPPAAPLPCARRGADDESAGRVSTMSAPGRPKRELLPLGGKARSAKGAL
jgi:ABC-type proline/glycine betaine transport system permease subunit